MKSAEEALRRLRKKGLRVTPQRMALAKALEGDTRHPVAEEVYQRIASIMPTISRATVYKGLETLCNVGELQELKVAGDAVRYDPKTEAHSHCRCRKCGGLFDISFCLPEKLPERVGDDFGVEGAETILHGICKRCREEPNA